MGLLHRTQIGALRDQRPRRTAIRSVKQTCRRLTFDHRPQARRNPPRHGMLPATGNGHPPRCQQSSPPTSAKAPRRALPAEKPSQHIATHRGRRWAGRPVSQTPSGRPGRDLHSGSVSIRTRWVPGPQATAPIQSSTTAVTHRRRVQRHTEGDVGLGGQWGVRPINPPCAFGVRATMPVWSGTSRYREPRAPTAAAFLSTMPSVTSRLRNA
jgi:hypothetical protein